MGVDLTQHLVSGLTNSDLEKAQLLHMKVKELAVSCESHILTDRFISWCDQILQVEDESVLLDFLNLLEETRVQSTFFNIKADSVDLLGYVEFKPMLFYQVDAEHKVLNVGSHDTNDQNDLKGKFLYSHVGLLGVIQDLVKEGTCLVNGLIRYEKGLIDPVQ